MEIIYIHPFQYIYIYIYIYIYMPRIGCIVSSHMREHFRTRRFQMTEWFECVHTCVESTRALARVHTPLWTQLARGVSLWPTGSIPDGTQSLVAAAARWILQCYVCMYVCMHACILWFSDSESTDMCLITRFLGACVSNCAYVYVCLNTWIYFLFVCVCVCVCVRSMRTIMRMHAHVWPHVACT